MGHIASIPRPRLELRDLQVVLAVAAAGTTAAAASTLHLSQPAVSRALLAAEERLGARLFDRSPRGLQATPAGEQLVAGATRLLAELVEIERRARAPAARPTRVRLVCECYTAYHWLPTALADLRTGLPNLDLVLAVEHTRAPVEALVAGAIDVALLTTGEVPPGELATQPLFTDEIVFVVSPTHELAKKPTLSRDDLRKARLITGETPEAEVRWFVTRVFGRGPRPGRAQRLPLTEAILDVARAGMGVAVLSEWMAGPHLGRGDLLVKRVSSGPLRRPWRLAWRREADEPARLLLAALKSAAPAPMITGRR
ncbi:LysR family transcriptional regulator [Nannocystis radixulma]|uniref:LysR family transcriptional regulator n=1 Tax=Nannocystis radixulma TaxID=2995305 RepID=A0ABT5AY79_9BACT|nr:LysR family transcriptional regulator [Nannocystis radixulma]MDC0666792.1 LysR family transcriptional regulator [Nannocystis radixulma]